MNGHNRARAALLISVALLVPAGCVEQDPPTEVKAPASGSPATPTTTAGARAPTVTGTVATGLDIPWGLAFLPDGTALVSERDTALIKHISADGEVRRVGEVPGVDPGGEGGLLDLAVGPDFATDRMLYAYFTAADDNRVVRMKYRDTGLGAPEVVLDGIPKAVYHNGGRMVFGPDGMLYVGTGDALAAGASQDRDALAGKILRMTPDGEVPADNPFAGSLTWSLGHRNVQGLAFDSRGRLWASEFGQDTWDELNLILPGANYGWPEVEGIAEGNQGGEQFTDPVRVWRPDEASPSGIEVWAGSVWMAALKGSRLWEIPLRGPDAAALTGKPQDWFTGEYGRLRTVAEAPDGSLWVITSNTDGRGDLRPGDDRILRIGPR